MSTRLKEDRSEEGKEHAKDIAEVRDIHRVTCAESYMYITVPIPMLLDRTLCCFITSVIVDKKLLQPTGMQEQGIYLYILVLLYSRLKLWVSPRHFTVDPSPYFCMVRWHYYGLLLLHF